jgi:hypothetical protein
VSRNWEFELEHLKNKSYALRNAAEHELTAIENCLSCENPNISMALEHITYLWSIMEREL